MLGREVIEGAIADSREVPEAVKGLLLLGVSMVSDAKLEELSERAAEAVGQVLGHTLAAYSANGLAGVRFILGEAGFADELVDRVIDHADRIIG